VYSHIELTEAKEKSLSVVLKSVAEHAQNNQQIAEKIIS